MKNETKRKFEVTKKAKWMSYSIDDILYGLLQYYATYNPNETNPNHALYITKQNYAIHRKEIQECCGVSTRTLLNHLNKLINEHLIEEFTINGYPSYGIVNNRDCPYKIIDGSLLHYLCSTRNPGALKVYFTLLNWYEFKEDYEFTKKDIIEILGYKVANDSAYELVSYLLISLKRECLIDYSEYYDTRQDALGNIVPVPKMRLNHVVRTLDEVAKLQKLEGNDDLLVYCNKKNSK